MNNVSIVFKSLSDNKEYNNYLDFYNPFVFSILYIIGEVNILFAFLDDDFKKEYLRNITLINELRENFKTINKKYFESKLKLVNKDKAVNNFITLELTKLKIKLDDFVFNYIKEKNIDWNNLYIFNLLYATKNTIRFKNSLKTNSDIKKFQEIKNDFDSKGSDPKIDTLYKFIENLDLYDIEKMDKHGRIYIFFVLLKNSSRNAFVFFKKFYREIFNKYKISNNESISIKNYLHRNFNLTFKNDLKSVNSLILETKNKLLKKGYVEFSKNHYINKNAHFVKLIKKYPYYKTLTLYERVNNKNYRSYNVGINSVNYYAHRILAETFLPNPNKYKFLIAKDGNNRNLDLDNFVWTPYSAMGRVYKNVIKNTNTNLLNKIIHIFDDNNLSSITREKLEKELLNFIGVKKEEVSDIFNKKESYNNLFEFLSIDSKNEIITFDRKKYLKSSIS